MGVTRTRWRRNRVVHSIRCHGGERDGGGGQSERRRGFGRPAARAPRRGRVLVPFGAPPTRQSENRARRHCRRGVRRGIKVDGARRVAHFRPPPALGQPHLLGVPLADGLLAVLRLSGTADRVPGQFSHVDPDHAGVRVADAVPGRQRVHLLAEPHHGRRVPAAAAGLHSAGADCGHLQQLGCRVLLRAAHRAPAAALRDPLERLGLLGPLHGQLRGLPFRLVPDAVYHHARRPGGGPPRLHAHHRRTRARPGRAGPAHVRHPPGRCPVPADAGQPPLHGHPHPGTVPHRHHPQHPQLRPPAGRAAQMPGRLPAAVRRKGLLVRLPRRRRQRLPLRPRRAASRILRGQVPERHLRHGPARVPVPLVDPRHQLHPLAALRPGRRAARLPVPLLRRDRVPLCQQLRAPRCWGARGAWGRRGGGLGRVPALGGARVADGQQGGRGAGVHAAELLRFRRRHDEPAAGVLCAHGVRVDRGVLRHRAQGGEGGDRGLRGRHRTRGGRSGVSMAAQSSDASGRGSASGTGDRPTRSPTDSMSDACKELEASAGRCAVHGSGPRAVSSGAMIARCAKAANEVEARRSGASLCLLLRRAAPRCPHVPSRTFRAHPRLSRREWTERILVGLGLAGGGIFQDLIHVPAASRTTPHRSRAAANVTPGLSREASIGREEDISVGGNAGHRVQYLDGRQVRAGIEETSYDEQPAAMTRTLFYAYMTTTH